MNEKTHKETSGIDRIFNNFIKDFLSEMSHHDIMDNDQLILVPTQQTAAYLRLKIAEQGIYAGTRIMTAQDLISEIRCNSIKENNLDALLYGDPWSKENLTWRILQVFNNYADEFPDNFKYWIGADKSSQESTDEEDSLDIDPDTLKLIVSDVAADLFDWIFDEVPQGKRFIRFIISEKTSKFETVERNLSNLETLFTELITDSVCNNFPKTISALDISSALKQNKNSLSDCIQQYQITGLELTDDDRKKIETYENDHKIWEEKIAQGRKTKEPEPGAKTRQAIEFEIKSKELSQQFQAELIEAFNTALNKIDTPEAIDFLNKTISSARARFTTKGLSTSTIDYRKRKARRLTLAQTTAENYLRYLDQMPELLLELPNNQISQWQITLWKKLIQLNPEYGDPAQFITSFGGGKNINASIKHLPKSIFVYGFLFYSQSELNLISGLKNSNIKVKEYQLSDSGNLGPKLENWMPLENKIKKNEGYSLPQTTLHKCIGINRQVQVIQDLVVKLVNSQEENINPEEILILTPELDTLFPLLSFAFKHNNQRKDNSGNSHPSKHIKLWFSHEARNDQSSETNQYLLTLFSLLDGPANFQDIAKLFSLQGVLNAAGLSYDDGQNLIVLMQDAQAAWGWDYNSQLRSEILPNRTGTIEYVLRCIASAISVDTKEAICWDSNDSDTSVYTPKINSSITVSVAAKAIQYLEQLRNLICSINPKESYKAIDLTIDDWSAFLQESLDDTFFKPSVVDEKKARAIARKWLDKTGQILSLNPEENQITLTLDEVKKLAESRISKQRIPENMLPGAPVVCATNELHCTPYKHVILAGFTDKNFPLANKVYGDDALLNIGSEKINKLRNETRESFKQLYALLTSAEQVDIVYSSRSEYTGKVLDTPTVIADIEQELEQELSPVHSITYGLQPFSKPDTNLTDVHSYKDRSKMCAAYIDYRNKSTDRYSKKLSQWSFSKDQFDSQKEIDLSDLLNFYKDPTDYFVKKKLGIFISDDETKSYGLFDETEPSYLVTARAKASALTDLEAPNGFRYEPDNYEKDLYSPVISNVFKQLDSSTRNYAGVEALSKTIKKPDPAIEKQVMTVFAKLQYLFMDDAKEETSKRRFTDDCSFVPNLPMQINVDEYKISGTIKNCLVSESCVVEIESNTLTNMDNKLIKDRDSLVITIKAAILLLSQHKNKIEFGKLRYSKSKKLMSDILNTVTVQNNQILSDWLVKLIKIYLIGQQLPLPLDINTIKPYKSETDAVPSNTPVDKKTLYKFDKDNRNYHEEYDRVLWGENANWQELINIPIDQLENYETALSLICSRSNDDEITNEQESNGSIFKLLADQIDWSNVIDSPSDSKKGK
jgi:hypothetical protein